MTIARDHVLEVHRCYRCGQYYAIENWGPGSTGCVCCMSNTLTDLRQELKRAQRSVAAYKGLLARRELAR